jgi:hypothetical protein
MSARFSGSAGLPCYQVQQVKASRRIGKGEVFEAFVGRNIVGRNILRTAC